MKRVLVTSAGGAPATNFIRSLRDAPEPFFIVGVDADKYTLHRCEADRKCLVPRADDPDYVPVLRDIVDEHRIDFLHCQMSAEMLTVSAHRDRLGTGTLLPAHETIEICEDKFRSYERWSAAGLPVPRTQLLAGPDDLDAAFESLGPRLWLRATSGSAGRGSLPTEDKDEALRWVESHDGWGAFTAAECLQPQTVTWQSIWHDGDLVVAQGRRRLYWEFANRAPSGVTGVTGTGVTVSDPDLDALAIAAVRAVDPKPKGIFGVDLTHDLHGQPNLTEINIGRFFTTHHFFTAAGLNMPYILVKLGLGEEPPLPENRINPLPPDLAWVRGMDVLPTLVSLAEIDAAAEALERRLAALERR